MPFAFPSCINSNDSRQLLSKKFTIVSGLYCNAERVACFNGLGVRKDNEKDKQKYFLLFLDEKKQKSSDCTELAKK